MDSAPDFQALLTALNSVGLWAVFLWLYWDERKAHNKTRDELSAKVDRIHADHMADLKEIAGMRANLNRVGSIVQAHDTRPLPPRE